MNCKKITKTDILGRVEEYILEEKTGNKFQRIVGGFAWPSAVKPGFAVVVGEDREEDELFKKRHYRVLAESENQSPSELIKRCAELSSLYKVYPWYGDTQNRAMMKFFYDGHYRPHLIGAPLLDDPNSFESYLLRIREHTKANQKTLHFGQGSRLPTLLMEISPQNISKAATTRTAAQEFPGVAALGYSVTALDLYKYGPDPNEGDCMPEFAGMY